MKTASSFLRRVSAAILLAGAAWSQQPPDAQSNAALDKVLAQMDTIATNFRTTEAFFVWNQYEKVVNDTDTQKGKIYFRRVGKGIQMVADISEPDKKTVVFTDGKVEVYQPRIDQVTVYNAGKNREAFESFLVLGFGGSGHDMLKSFDVKFVGTENVDGVEAAKLNLVPKSPKIRNNFDHIVLWIDPARGISVQQQLFEPSGDYRLAKYSEIKLNQKIPDTVFKLSTTSKTKTVTPQ
jgi:outer membrane lipoprotein-sorting protein